MHPKTSETHTIVCKRASIFGSPCNA